MPVGHLHRFRGRYIYIYIYMNMYIISLLVLQAIFIAVHDKTNIYLTANGCRISNVDNIF